MSEGLALTIVVSCIDLMLQMWRRERQKRDIRKRLERMAKQHRRNVMTSYWQVPAGKKLKDEHLLEDLLDDEPER
jgi:hypothetical protein